MSPLEQAQRDYDEALLFLFHTHERYHRYPRDGRYYERYVTARLAVWKARQRLDALRGQAR